MLGTVPDGLIDLADIVERQCGPDAPLERMEIQDPLGVLLRNPCDLLIPCLARMTVGVAGAGGGVVAQLIRQKKLSPAE